MKGLELSRAFYEEYGKPMLEESFSDVLPYLAAGMFGSGSECMGFDDEVSRDHDFEPGFMILLPGEDVVDRRTAFALERAYAKLPKSFEGFTRAAMQPVGGARHGVMRLADFLMDKTGTPDGILTTAQWLTIPQQSLAEVTNGRLYFDNYGEVRAARERLSYYPEDVRRKILAGRLLIMAQAGQYNFTRCLQHGEIAAAQMAVFEFVKSAVEVIFLLNRRYQPYYKWSFRALRALPVLSIEAELMEYLITSDNGPENAEEKYDCIESIASDVIEELIEQELTKASCGDLEKHAYSVNDGVAQADLRNMHILAGV